MSVRVIKNNEDAIYSSACVKRSGGTLLLFALAHGLVGFRKLEDKRGFPARCDPMRANRVGVGQHREGRRQRQLVLGEAKREFCLAAQENLHKEARAQALQRWLHAQRRCERERGSRTK